MSKANVVSPSDLEAKVDKDFIDIFGKEDKRPKKNGWASGQYYGTCHRCSEIFLGDKRASQCADCAYGEKENKGT